MTTSLGIDDRGSGAPRLLLERLHPELDRLGFNVRGKLAGVERPSIVGQLDHPLLRLNVAAQLDQILVGKQDAHGGIVVLERLADAAVVNARDQQGKGRIEAATFPARRLLELRGVPAKVRLLQQQPREHDRVLDRIMSGDRRVAGDEQLHGGAHPRQVRTQHVRERDEAIRFQLGQRRPQRLPGLARERLEQRIVEVRRQTLGAMLGHVAAEPLRKVTQMLVHASSSLLRPGVEARRRTDSRLLILTGI